MTTTARPRRSLLDIFLAVALLGDFFRLAYWGALVHLRQLPLHSDPIHDFPLVSAWIKPEPFELPLYALLMALILLIIISCARQGWSTQDWNRAPRMGAAALGLLLFADLIGHLGHFPLFNVHPVDSLAIWAYSFSMLATAFGGAFLLTRVPIGTRREGWADAAAAVTAFFFIFEPGLPMSVFDYGFWLGPAWEISRGKTIYTQVASQYGFGATLATAALFKLGLRMADTPYFVSFGFIADTFLLYLIVSRASKSRALGWAAMFAVIELHFLTIPADFSQVAMGNCFRWIFAPLITLCTLEAGLTAPLTVAVAVAAPFWTPDTGLQILGAYVGSCGAIALLGRLSPRQVVRVVGLIVVNIIAWIAALQALHLVLGYKLIDFMRLFLFMRVYAVSGYNMAPSPRETFFYFTVALIVLGWGVSVSALAPRNASSERDAEAEAILLLSSLGFTTCAYYIGRSVEGAVYVFSALPACSGAMAAAALLKRWAKSAWTRQHADSISAFGVILVFVAIVNIQTRATAYMFLSRRVEDYRALGFRALKPGHERHESWAQAGAIARLIEPQAAELRARIPAEELTRPMAILSIDDTYLHEALGTSSIFRMNPLYIAVDRDSVEEAANVVRRECPPHLIVDRTALNDRTPGDPPIASISYAYPELQSLPRYVLGEARKHCRYDEEYCGSSVCLLTATGPNTVKKYSSGIK